jgi:hypothetical protein
MVALIDFSHSNPMASNAAIRSSVNLIVVPFLEMIALRADLMLLQKP